MPTSIYIQLFSALYTFCSRLGSISSTFDAYFFDLIAREDFWEKEIWQTV